MTKKIKTYRVNTKDELFEKAWQSAVEKVDTIKADRAILIASNGEEMIVSLMADETEQIILVYAACCAVPECARSMANGVLAYMKENVK